MICRISINLYQTFAELIAEFTCASTSILSRIYRNSLICDANLIIFHRKLIKLRRKFNNLRRKLKN